MEDKFCCIFIGDLRELDSYLNNSMRKHSALCFKWISTDHLAALRQNLDTFVRWATEEFEADKKANWVVEVIPGSVRSEGLCHLAAAHVANVANHKLTIHIMTNAGEIKEILEVNNG